MITHTPENVAYVVQKYLRRSGRAIRVIPDAVLQQGDPQHTWWYVPVMISQPPARMYDYYEVLNDVEEELEQHESLNVLLIPGVSEEQPEEQNT